MKKQIVSIILAMLLFATISIAMTETNDGNSNSPLDGSGEDVDWWPQFFHDSGNTGSSSSEAPDTNNTIWIKEFDAIDMAYYPVIDDGKLYVGIGDDTDSNVHSLYCFDSLTGEVIWVNHTGLQFRSTPVVANDKVYLILGISDLVCFDADTGDFLWDEYIGGPCGYHMTFDNDRLFIGISYSPQMGSRYIGCYDSENGSLIWAFYTDDSIKTTPAVADNKVFFCSTNTFYCLDAEGNGDGTTTEYWNISTGYLGSGAPAPCVINGKIFLGNATGFYCFNTSDGSIIWDHPLMSTATSPVCAYGKVYISSFTDHKLYCLDAEGNGDGTTTEYWNISNMRINPSIADGKLFINGYNEHVLYCFDTETGQQIWNYSIDGTLTFSCLADGMAFFVVHNYIFDTTHIYCFRDNSPPETPDQPAGPTEGQVDIEYLYWAGSYDLDEDSFYIKINFGNEETGWLGPYAPDDDIPSVGHSWKIAGIYEVKAKAKDVYGAESEWSEPLEVEIFGPEFEIGDITGGLLSVKTNITNSGEVAINEIDWSISVKGGFLSLINKNETGTINTLEPGASEEISISPIIGLGPIVITVTANAEGIDEIEKTADGFVIFFFVIIP